MKEYIYLSENGEIHYWYSNICTDITLVFLHGLSADHRLFTKQIEYFQDKYNCLVWDAPAHGLSRPYNELSYPDCAKQLRNILNQHSIENPVFIGQSMGAYIAQSFLLRYPGIMKGFVSVDSCPYGNEYYSNSDRWWLKQIEWMSKCYPEKSLKKAVAKQCTTTKRSRDNMYSMLEVYSKNELCHLMGMGYVGFLNDCQELTISCPVCLIVGQKDITGKVKQYNEQWHKNTGHPIYWIENAAHNSNDDQPEVVNEIIEKFVLEQIKL